MGIQKYFVRAGNRAANAVAKAAVLAPDQLEQLELEKEHYLNQMPDPTDTEAQEMTRKYLSMAGVEIYHAYLPDLAVGYMPMQADREYDRPFQQGYNIRLIRLNRWVSDKEENSLEKLVSVYEVLANENCSIALIFHRRKTETDVYLGVVNLGNDGDNVKSNQLRDRMEGALRGHFPGSDWKRADHRTELKWLDNPEASVASITNLPGEKSEKFISQTIEKLLDGFVPSDKREEYTLILLASPVHDVEERKQRLAQIYSALHPYSAWETDYHYNESTSQGSSASVGVNVGVGAGTQQGANQNVSQTHGVTDSSSDSNALSNSKTNGETRSFSRSNSHGVTNGSSDTFGASETQTVSASVGVSTGVPGAKVNASVTAGTSSTNNYSHSWNRSVTDSVSNSISSAANTASTIGRTLTQTLGRALSQSVSVAEGVTQGIFRSVNFGANFSRSSNVSAQIGKNEGITQHFTNFNIKKALEQLEEQMKRMDLASALGLWDFAAYVVGEDPNVVNNAAHTYLALTQGEKSHLSSAAINLWRGDMGEKSSQAREICKYLRQLRHPQFGLNPLWAQENPQYYTYPLLVNGTSALTGKELAYSLNFPRKSVAGFPVVECVSFGRNVTSHNQRKDGEKLPLGHIYHMQHQEEVLVQLDLDSLTAHTFITGSTGSGKSSTIYHILNEMLKKQIPFLVVEPAKGEYKNVFGSRKDVHVYGTNPKKGDLLRINPFSFPEDIHVLEHADRLIEIFNVCWPMYAAMPAVLKDAVLKSYQKAGWDLVTSTNRYHDRLFPTFADVAKSVREIINSSEYDSENKGAYKGSLLTRLNSLTNGINGMIFTSDELSDSKLFDENVIVDLSRVGSQETRSLLMGLLMLKLQEYRMSEEKGMNRKLSHITVLEEAHNLLKRTTGSGSPDSADLAGKSVEMIANAIAEMRTYGEGFIIADQAPGLLDLSAIRNTNTKIIMRLPEMEDRMLAGKASGLKEEQIDELAKLPVGVAAVFQNDWTEPVLCAVDKDVIEEQPWKPEKHFDRQMQKDKTGRIQLAWMLLEEIPLRPARLNEEVGDLMERLNLSAQAKVKIYHLMEMPAYKRSMEDEAEVMQELFESAETYIQDYRNRTRGFDGVEEGARQALEENVGMIDASLANPIIQLLVYYAAQVLNDLDHYHLWLQEIESKEGKTDYVS